MNNQISGQILEKINALNRELQALRIEAYFSLPKERTKSLYPETALRKAIRTTRQSIWQERYAKTN